MAHPSKRLIAEALGTLLLVCTVVGSGIMAERLTGDTALALLGNTVATGAILVVLIWAFGDISGAHFNPAVTLVMRLRGNIGTGLAVAYMAVQVAGGLAGTALAHLMFDDAARLVPSPTERTGLGQWVAEGVATFGLLMTILATMAHGPARVAPAVGLYITAGYWFTASTSFANPAVTIARAFTPTFSGIAPADAPAFIAMQAVGALLALAIVGWLLRPPSTPRA